MATIHVAPQRQPTEAWIDAEFHFRRMLQSIGYDPDTNMHLYNTPHRYMQMLYELFHDEPWEFTTFVQPSGEPGQAGDAGIIVVRDIPFTSLCAHHFAPFFGHAHVAYIPKERLPGLSKIARTITSFSKGPNVQEDITRKSIDFLVEQLNPLGVMVILEAEHTCMTKRGAKAHDAITITSAVRGVFFDDARARQEALTLIKGIR